MKYTSLALIGCLVVGCSVSPSPGDVDASETNDAQTSDAGTDASRRDAGDAAAIDAATAVDAAAGLDSGRDASIRDDARAVDAYVADDAWVPVDAYVPVDACMPATCGARTCGTINDGCGHLVRCGADCGTWHAVAACPVSGPAWLAHVALGQALLVSRTSNRTFEYDAATDGWTEHTAAPGAVLRLVAEASGGVVVGVRNDATLEYDHLTHGWTTFAAPPAQLQSAAHAGGPNVLAFGTFEGSSYAARTFTYSTATHAWTELAASGPPARGSATMAWLGSGRVFMTGGIGNATGTPPILDDAWVFDLATGSWSTATAPDVGGRYLDGAAFLAIGTVLTYGGSGVWSSAPTGSALDRRFDFVAASWTSTTTGALVAPGVLRQEGMTNLSGGRVLLVGGTLGNPGTATAHAWIYDDGTGVSDLD